MAGFLYAFDGREQVPNKTLEEAGLTAIIGPVNTQRHNASGPAGADCMLITAGTDAALCRYKPNEQTWQESISGKYQVGFYINDRPTPADLIREEQVSGHKVKIDGCEWLIPLARMFPEGTRLPQTLLMGPEGTVIQKIIPKYAEFAKKAETLWEDMQILLGLAEGEPKLTDAESWLMAGEAFKLNYRIGPDEINALELITTQNIFAIFGAIIDLPTIEKVTKELLESQKKNALTKDG